MSRKNAQVSRRSFLRGALFGGGAVVLAACGAPTTSG
ncbi:MAG: twin-arginine translocation signal domain-containing protein, partial [Roseiflexaceae bacterium]|nr:twin-arginine translocation signal domain-containing protein [Roseiflexaceae bacterium]